MTRPADQAQGFVAELEALGAEAVLLPSIRIAPPENKAALIEAVKGLAGFDWVVLTSVNGVKALLAAMEECGVPRSVLADRKLAVIGPSTAKALAEAVREPDVLPEEYVAEAIAEALPEIRGKNFLLPRADLARPELAQILADRGGQVTNVVAYRIVRDEAALPENAETPDYITLTSGSAATNTVEALKSAGKEEWLKQAKIVCIGPVTDRALQGLGYESAAVADEYTVPGLIATLVRLEEERRARI